MLTLKKVENYYVISFGRGRPDVDISADELLQLRDEISFPCAQIIQDKVGHVGDIDRDDEILEDDFRKMRKPRKKRAERLNDGDDACPSTT